MHRLKKKFEKLNSALRIAFSKIKYDIVTLQKQQVEQERKLDIDFIKGLLKEEIKREIMHEIGNVQSKVDSEKSTPMAKAEAFGKRSVKSTERSVSVRRTPNTTILPKSRIPTTTGLTSLHLELLKRLMLLQMESSKRAISMRELASELYPNKEYDRIKSTLSEYIKKLYEAGLVEKLQKGKLYLSYTEKALQYADNLRLAQMKELISKPPQTVR